MVTRPGPTPAAAVAPSAPHGRLAEPAAGARWRQALWLAPLALSLLFVLAILWWARSNEQEELEEQRQTLISDALSAEAQLRAQLDLEAAQLRLLADALSDQRAGNAALAGQPIMTAGLRRLWQSVTWLDGDNRILAHQPPDGAPAVTSDNGLSLHLVVPVGPEARHGTLVVRYAPATLLKRGVPWWLARKYDVQLVDSADLVIASTPETLLRSAGSHPDKPRLSYRISFPGPLRSGPLAQHALNDAALELTLREPPLPVLRPLGAGAHGRLLVVDRHGHCAAVPTDGTGGANPDRLAHRGRLAPRDGRLGPGGAARA